MARLKKKNYVNNNDLLREINKSKLSYCYVLDPCFGGYDYIVFNENEIDDELIAKAMVARISRLNKDTVDGIEKHEKTTSKKAFELATERELLVSEVEPDDVVIRVMTDDHIPFDEDSEDDIKIKTNFKPFKHYVINTESNEIIEVVRSHWIGDLDTGEFSQTHGNITNELCKMMMKMVEECSKKSGFRTYTYLDEMMMEARFHLTKNALKFNEHILYRKENPAKQLNPFSYYTSFVLNAFRICLNNEKRQRDIRDDLLEEAGFEPSITRQMDIYTKMINDKRNQK